MPFPRLYLLPCLGLALLSLAPGGAAMSPTRPDAPPGQVSRLVLLDLPTRWDAWVAAGGASVSSDDGDEVQARQAYLAADLAAARVARGAAPVMALVEASGGAVLARYDTATAGLLVRLPPDAAGRLVGLAGVRAVHPAPQASLALVDSVPSTGAGELRQDLGLDGRGVVIAVADTGVDYTHAALGGPGDVAAYEAAAAAAERIDDTWAGRLLFPTERVVAGWDFAGPLYAPDCDPILERMGRCSVAPQPDPDPLDVHGHGSHVASVAAGRATGPVAEGMAPGATLVALKIFGAGGRTELLIDPIEWVIEANMGQAGRPRVDVLNLSVGRIYGGDVLNQSGVIRRAVDAGVVVVAAAGNEGNLPFVAGAPAVAPEALAVASHIPPGRHGYEAELRAGQGPELRFGESSVYHQGWSPDPRGPLQAPAVFVGRACPEGNGQAAEPLLADPRGALAVFQMAWGGVSTSCSADRQARRLQEAGAVGALMATAIGAPSASAWEARPLVDIPVWMVATDFEQALVAGAQAGTPMTVTMIPVPHPDLSGVVSEFTSRGPSQAGLLKPDLSAPGTGVFGAAMGQGRRGVLASGTSVAAPHVAGAAALLWEASRRQDQALKARDIAALLVTTADPQRLRRKLGMTALPPLARSGAGALDIAAAVRAETVLRAGALATLDLGVHALAQAQMAITRQVKVANLSAEARDYRIDLVFREPTHAQRGLELSVDPPTFSLAPGASRDLVVTASLLPGAFPPWGLSGGEKSGSGAAMADSELDGWLVVDGVAADGQPASRARLPFYALVRAASAVWAEWQVEGNGSAATEGPWTLDLGNTGATTGQAEVFHLAATDPVEPDLAASADLVLLGVRALAETATGTTRVEFLLHSRGARMSPLATESVIELDTDLDGRLDYRLYTADEELRRTGRFRNGKVIVALEEPGGGAFGSPRTRYHAGVDVNGRFTVLAFQAEDTGLTPSTLVFRYRARHRDLLDPLDDAEDRVPAGQGWLTFDGRRPALVPETKRLELEPGERQRLSVAQGPGFGDAARPRLVILFPSNVPGAGDVAVLPAYADPRPALWLPWAGRP